MRAKLNLSSAFFWLILFMTVTLFTGLMTFQNYGVSWDEPGIFRFTKEVIQPYYQLFHPEYQPKYQEDPILWKYGPFYFLLTHFFVQGLKSLGIPLIESDLWHLFYFITFEVGILVFYKLARRWLEDWPALAATILFATQPLFWGHAFINPKDTPFMVFFMSTLLIGFRMVDNLPQTTNSAFADIFTFIRIAKSEWRSLPISEKKRSRRNFVIFTSISLIVLLVFPVFETALAAAILFVYQSPAESIIGRLLRLFSSQPESIPVESFINKASLWLFWLQILLALAFLDTALIKLFQRLPNVSRIIVKQIFWPLKSFFLAITNPSLVLAALLLGFSISIRLLALLAGGFVSLYLIKRLRARAIPTLAAYATLALATMYATWPFLWDAPLKRLLKSWEVMSDFSATGSWKTLPTLLLIQYTEPAVILSIIGVVVALIGLWHKQKIGLVLLFLGWTALPLGILMAGQQSMYDNFRQMMFLLPPFFLLVGWALEVLFHVLKRPLWMGLAIIIFALPGVFANIQLHPYQYVYYNSFVGGVKGAFRHYETDYWGISFRAVADYLNSTLPTDAKVVVCGSPDALNVYLRPDLTATLNCKETVSLEDGYQMAVLSSRYNTDRRMYPNAPVVFRVKRAGAVLVVVKSLR
jgi:hypothetical protein